MAQHSSLLFLFAFFALASAAPQLLLHISGPRVVQRSHDLNLDTTITNIGPDVVQLLRHPRSPLSTAPTNMFNIWNSLNDQSPRFVGVEISYADDVSVESVDDADDPAIIVLVPGQSVKTHHLLLQAYDFSPSGSGPYSVMMRDARPLHVLVAGQITQVAPVHVAVHHFDVAQTVISARKTELAMADDEGFCLDWQNVAIHQAISVAQEYAHAGLQELKDESDRGYFYRRWFGSRSAERLSTTLSHFENIVANDYSEYHYFCGSWICDADTRYIAYVDATAFGNVTLCPRYFDRARTPLYGYKSGGSTIVHESTHFVLNGGTEDYAYTVQTMEQLARTSPAEAIMNAASHEFFAVDAYSQRSNVRGGRQTVIVPSWATWSGPVEGFRGFREGTALLLARLGLW